MPKGRNRRNNTLLARGLEYIPWLRYQFEKKEMTNFKRLVDGPSFYAKSYKSYAVNGYVFSTYDSEVNMTTQNSGVSIKALTNFMASAKDTNLVEDEATYYGIVKQILELDYVEFKHVVFYCDWVRIEDKRNGCVVDPDSNLVFVNLERLQKNDKEDSDPFILASEATQIFYCKDVTRDSWHVVVDSPKRLNVDVDAFEDPLVFDAKSIIADNDFDQEFEDIVVFPLAERKEVQFDNEGLPIGPNVASFTSFIGKNTMLHVSPTIDDWPSVLDSTKQYIWDIVLGKYNIERKHRKDVLLKANTSWKNWKHRIRRRYDEHTTDVDRRLNRPKGVKPEDWETIMQKCSTEAEKRKREQGVAARKQVKLLHTSGRRGAARTKQDLMKQNTSGTVSRTQLFVALHTPKNGSHSHPHTRITLEEIDLLLDLDPTMDEEDLDHDPVAVVCRRDGNGSVRGYSNGVTKTVLETAAPYKKSAKCEKRKREDTEAKFESLTQRLDEESAARKILEEKMMSNMHTSSSFDNYNQEHYSRALDGSQVLPTSSHCLLMNFKKKPAALGVVCRDETTSADLYRVRIDDIYEYDTDLFEQDGKLGDISVC